MSEKQWKKKFSDVFWGGKKNYHRRRNRRKTTGIDQTERLSLHTNYSVLRNRKHGNRKKLFPRSGNKS